MTGDREYRRRVRAWALYDWGNSAFATVVLTAVMPVYYATVAADALPSRARATAYWTFTLGVSLGLVALLAPVLGTIADLRRGKKRFLSLFAGIGILGTGLLVLVGTGDWLLASALVVVGRVGFSGANVFYDALLPHVAREEDRSRVSALGYAAGYLGGGLLLALAVVLIRLLGNGHWGVRLSFPAVALWWAIFAVPLLRRVPEPPAAAAAPGTPVLRAGLGRLRDTFRRVRRHRQFFRFLLAYLLYNDGIGTVISVAAIYGTELELPPDQMILAILMVQFAGIPLTLLFGRIATPGARGRAVCLAFVAGNLLLLPAAGIAGRNLLPAALTGAPPPLSPAPEGSPAAGRRPAADAAAAPPGAWRLGPPPDLPPGVGGSWAETRVPGATLAFRFRGRRGAVVFRRGPDAGRIEVLLDGEIVLFDGVPYLEGGRRTARWDERAEVTARHGGDHELVLRCLPGRGPAGAPSRAAIRAFEVLPPERAHHTGFILGGLLALEALLALLALFPGRRLLRRAARGMDARRGVLLSLAAYTAIALWGFSLDSVFEFWLLAFLVGVVLGGSQALSRSLCADLSPPSASGEFFGLFSVMSRFSAVLGPLAFAGAALAFGSSRPAVLGIAAFFLAGGALLLRVDVEEGRRTAREEDARLRELAGGSSLNPPGRDSR